MIMVDRLLLILPVEVAMRTIARTEVLIDTIIKLYIYMFASNFTKSPIDG